MDNHFFHSQEYLAYLESLPKDFYISILENLFLGVFVSDAEGKTLYVNPAVIKHYGKKPEELVGHTDWGQWEGIIFPPAYKQMCKEKRPLVYRQKNMLTRNYMTTITTPVLKDNKDLDFTVHVIQENFDHSDFDVDAKALHLKKENPRQNLIGESRPFMEKIIEVERVARSDMAILLLGESGTGKTVIARYIHECSNRKDGPFVSINCGAIPESLLESELFGYVSGSFTGATTKGKKGLLETADGGTVFLDEIGDLPVALQVKILHALENKSFMPVGGSAPIEVDIRVISATNRNLKELIAEKQFREDLYWRISAFTSYIPPLRERREDILPLALHFLKKQNLKYGTQKVFHSLTLIRLLQYDWPGNVRELRNVIERIYVLTSGSIIYENKIPEEMSITNLNTEKPLHTNSLDQTIDQIQCYIIREAYSRFKTSTGVAKALAISQPKASRLIRKYCDCSKKKE